MKDSLNVVDPKKVKSKVQTLFPSHLDRRAQMDLMNTSGGADGMR